MGIGKVNHLDGRFAARRRSAFRWLGRRECQVEWTDVWEIAETDQSRAEGFGCVGTDVHVLEGVVQCWNLAGDDTGADIAILCLYMGSEYIHDTKLL